MARTVMKLFSSAPGSPGGRSTMRVAAAAPPEEWQAMHCVDITGSHIWVRKNSRSSGQPASLDEVHADRKAVEEIRTPRATSCRKVSTESTCESRGGKTEKKGRGREGQTSPSRVPLEREGSPNASIEMPMAWQIDVSSF